MHGMTLDEMKRRYDALQERIRKLEAERAAIVARGEPVPSRISLYLAEDRIAAEELRTWANRELTRQLREAV